MKNWSLILCIITVFVAVSGCNRPGGNNLGPEDKASAAAFTATPETIPVEIERVAQGKISEYLETTSNIYADNKVSVYPKLSGQIEKILVEEGDSVAMGQILAVMDDDEYRLRLRQADVARDQALEKRNRLSEMYQSQMVSQESYNDAEYAYQDSEVAWELAMLNYQNTRIKSPISGVITRRDIHIGDLVSNSTKTFEILDEESLKVDVHLPEREISKIRKNMKAEIIPDSLPDRLFNAFVQRINPAVDPKTGTQKITLSFAKEEIEDLTAGMYVRVKILLQQRQNAVLLPKRSVLRRKDETSIFVMNEDGIAEKRKVLLGLENMHSFEVLAGLSPGEKLIVVGQHNLEDGQAVRSLNADSSPAETDESFSEQNTHETVPGSDV